MNIITKTCTANVAQAFQVPKLSSRWRIVSAPANSNLTLIFLEDGSKAVTKPGGWGKADMPFSEVEITCDTTGAVTLQWSVDGWVFDQQIPLTISGNVNNTPVAPNLMVDKRFGGPPYTYALESSWDGQSLLVNGDTVTSAQTSGPSLGNLTTRVFGMLRIQLDSGATPGDSMLVTMGAEPVPIYDSKGRWYSNGIITFDANNAVGKVFYIDCRPAGVITFAAVVGDVQFVYTGAPDWALPKPPEQEDYTNTELGSTAIGALATGASFFWTTIGVYRKTTGSVAKGAKRMIYSVSFTVTAVGTALLLYGVSYSKLLVASRAWVINLGTLTGVAWANGTTYRVNIYITYDGRVQAEAYDTALTAAVGTSNIFILPVDDLDLEMNVFAGTITMFIVEVRIGY